MLVSKLSSNIHFINPSNNTNGNNNKNSNNNNYRSDFVLSPTKYFNNPFNAIMTASQLSLFVVLDSNNNNSNNNNKSKINNSSLTKLEKSSFIISDVEVDY